MKTRQDKDHTIEELQHKFGQCQNALLVAFQGIKVADDERLRREMRQASLSYYVVKNTLAILAAKGTPIEQVSNHFTGATAVALSENDPVTLAKVLSKWARASPVFSFKAGVAEGRVVSLQEIEALSNMPSKEELISKVMFLINSGAQRMAVATAGVARNLALVIEQIRAQKEQQEA